MPPRRKKPILDAAADRWRGDSKREASHPTALGYVREYDLPLPVDRTLELRWDALPDGDLPDVAGARVKPVLFLDEVESTTFDRGAFKERLREAGAVYVKAPVVHVLRRRSARDDRHAADVPLEESLRMFAQETHCGVDHVEFAAALAREADAGVTE